MALRHIRPHETRDDPMTDVQTPASGNERAPEATDKIWFVHVLRGFAALLVVFCHLGVETTRPSDNSREQAPWSPSPTRPPSR